MRKLGTRPLDFSHAGPICPRAWPPAKFKRRVEIMATLKARISDKTLNRIREYRDGNTTDAEAIEEAIKESVPVARKIEYVEADKTVTVEIDDGKAIEHWIESGVEMLENTPATGFRA